MSSDLFRVHYAADERRERGIAGELLHSIEARVSKIADARSKPEPRQMTKCEDVIGESGGVRVMLLDAEIGFVV